MLILIRNDGDHIAPLPETQELLVKVLDRTGRHISVIAVTENSSTNEVTIAVEPPVVEHAKVVLGEAGTVAAEAAMAAAEGGPEA